MRNPMGNRFGFGGSSNQQQRQMLFVGIFASVLAAGMLWYAFTSFGGTATSSKGALPDETDEEEKEDAKVKDLLASLAEKQQAVSADSTPSTPLTSNAVPPSSSGAAAAAAATTTAKDTTTTADDDAAAKAARESIHRQVEDADKRGKALFKKKDYLPAASCFTEALDLINSSNDESSSSSLKKQKITLMNNRSAMYEKAGLAELAFADCDAILSEDKNHEKARMRKMRILESEGRHGDALVEVCALQLRFMRDNRDKLRMGIPVKPPVSQDKIEELMGHILPTELDDTYKRVKDTPRNLPSDYTILQLLKSFSGYNTWMSAAARGENAAVLSEQIEALKEGEKVRKAELLLRRGRRYMYDQRYDDASRDFEEAYKIVHDGGDDEESVADAMEDYPRLLEWVGICRHLRYDLAGALKCYEKCSDLEPTNAEILVKRAGVKMDDGKNEESVELFQTALGLEPDAVDALLHRSNLFMLQQKSAEAKTDLERCIQLRPDFVLPRLRLATVLMTENDLKGAGKCLDAAEESDPDSSEVHSYRGEMHFAQGAFTEAKSEFDRAIECEPGNPTPYVNAALAMMNTPTSTGVPDVQGSVDLLTRAIEVDPMFHAAYVHLGQLKLSMATNLAEAREVISLYDRGIKQCRTKEELKDIISMRILTVAQADAASALGMETLNMS